MFNFLTGVVVGTFGRDILLTSLKSIGKNTNYQERIEAAYRAIRFGCMSHESHAEFHCPCVGPKI